MHVTPATSPTRLRYDERHERPRRRQNLTSLQSHILSEEERYPGAGGDFTWILSALSLAAKSIAAKVRTARIEDVLGDYGDANVHGESQQKLDVIANEILMTCLGNRPSMALVASEEDEEPTILRRGNEGGKYCVVFDPLDGSSNLDVCVERRDDLLHPPQRPDDSRRGRNALPAGPHAGRGRLHPVRFVDGLRPHDGQRRGHVRARSGDRLVRARQEPDPHSGRGRSTTR